MSLTRLALSRIAAVCCAIFASSAFADIKTINQTERLSDWLKDSKNSASNSYPLGLSWHSYQEVQQQQLLKLEVLNALHRHQANTKYRRLAEWLEQSPVTGRVLLPKQDPYWLEVNPAFDPILQPQDQVVTIANPQSVTVIQSNGLVCTVPFRSFVKTSHYLETCDVSVTHGFNPRSFWVIQADGVVEQHNGNPFNQQPAISAGAWIWLSDDLPSDLSKKIAQLLSYVGASGTPELDDWLKPSRIFMDTPALIAQQLFKSTTIRPTSSDWGSVGILQTPNARMQDEGYASVTYSNVQPYERYSVMLQPWSWLEFGFRYTDINNRLYGSTDFSGDQTYKDKSIDAKLSISNESHYFPAIAVGFRDMVGTGLFSSEYIVASKRSDYFDWSLGLGWGYMAGRQDFKNPLSYLKDSFNQRPPVDVGRGGDFGNGYFRGPTSIFGGVEYQTPWKDIILKAEYEGNNYEREPQQNLQNQKSPINLGLIYKWGPADLSVAWERGDRVMLSITFGGNLAQLSTPKVSEAPKIPVQASYLNHSHPVTTMVKLDKTLDDFYIQTGWAIETIEQYPQKWHIVLRESTGQQISDRVKRGISVLHRDAPSDIQTFEIEYKNKDLKIITLNVNRQYWVQSQTQWLGPHDKSKVLSISEPSFRSDLNATPLINPSQSWGSFGLGLGYRQTLGGPDGFLLYSLSAQANSEVNLWHGAWLSNTLEARLADNYDKFKFGGTSELPRVRTHIKEYLTSSPLTIPTLQINQTFQATSNQYFNFYGGLLESMFGGIGGEWLYRPAMRSWALGLDINQVKQRGFDQDFSFLDYKATTGHLTHYWDTGWQDIFIKTSIGQYLAGDKGTTLDVSRIFNNGVRIGAFATKTNISAQQFGEGSFDKGIYVQIPFDVFFTKHSNSVANILWSPLTRDGGAKLNRTQTLYDLTQFKDGRLTRSINE